MVPAGDIGGAPEAVAGAPPRAPLPSALAGAPDGIPDEPAASTRRGRWREWCYLSGTALQMAFAAVVTPVVTRLIGPSDFGRVAAAMAVVQVLFCIECLGLSVGVQRVHAERPDGVRTSRVVQTWALAAAVACTAALYATSGPLGRPLGFSGPPVELHLTVLWGGATAFTGVLLARLRSEDRVAAFTAAAVAQGPGAQLLAMGAVFAWQRTAAVYLAGLLAGQVLAAAIGLATSPLAVRGLGLRRLGGILAFSLPLVPQQVANFALNSSDRLIVQRQLGAVPLARYSLAYNLAGTGATLLSLLNVVWLPAIFAAPEGPARAAVLAGTRDRVLRLALPVMVGLGFAGPAVLLLWAPPSFQPAGLAGVATLIALATLPTAAYTSEYRLLVAAGRTGAVALATGACAALNVALNVVLVPRMGIDGSALATLAAFATLAGAAHLLARRITPLPAVPRRLMSAAAAATAATAASALLPVEGGWVAVRIVAGAACLLPLAATVRGGLAPPPGPAEDPAGAPVP